MSPTSPPSPPAPERAAGPGDPGPSAADRVVQEWFALGLDPGSGPARPGPGVDELAARLSSAPREMSDPAVDLVALACDAVPQHEVAVARAAERVIATGLPDARTGAALVLWLLASPALLGGYAERLQEQGAGLAVLAVGMKVAPLSPPATWFTDERAREEVVRTLLWACHQVPAGEDEASARSRLAACDSVARSGALAQARQAYDHRVAVARRLQDARAREAAQRYGNE